MATIILGTIGRAFAGPLGGLAGTFAGGMVDRGIFGNGKRRDVGRIADLVVQSAAYGEPFPIVTGRMRTAGNLVWTSGIKESSTRSGGGKRGGQATTTYSYSASFAVALSGRAVASIGRIWADGRIIRDAGGAFLSPVTMRLHGGSESQSADPLIAAFEGQGGTPAYRGLAYVVFEDLPLADYGNRIPNLSFEINSETVVGPLDAGQAIAALGMLDGRQIIDVDGAFPPIAGHYAGQGGSIADAISALVELSDASIFADKRTRARALRVRAGNVVTSAIAAGDCHAHLPNEATSQDRRQRLDGNDTASAVELSFHDTSRDFQPGLQRVRNGRAGGVDHQAAACAMSPDEAKTLALDMLTRSHSRRLRAALRLPWRHIGLEPGCLVTTSDDTVAWRVRGVRFESFIVHLELERAALSAAVALTGDGGRSLAFDDQVAGPTTLRLLDLPQLPGETAVLPRLWVAAAGASPGWRRAAIEASIDDGASYAGVGIVEGGAVQGTAITLLRAGDSSGWDRHGCVDVELLSDAMWLEGRTPEAVLAGGNLALLGNEIVQFAVAEALSPRRFRLSGLLRGRRGTEAAIASHAVGDRFVLLGNGALLGFDPPIEALGRVLRIRPAGSGDAGTMPQTIMVGGAALRPLSPVHMTLARTTDGILARWIRRSRSGYGWTDFVDAPLGEENEAYLVDIAIGGVVVRQMTVTGPSCLYALADWHDDGGGRQVRFTAAQMSAAVGPGFPASASAIFL